jgi:DHA1 family tetracycline resistance protein-like MFS transporter
MNGQRALVFIFCTVTLDIMALGLVIPVLPTLVLGFMDGDTAGAAQVFGVFAAVWAAMQFLFSPVLGALSDRHGRRPVILLSCLGLGLDYVFMALAPSLLLLFVGRVISGITSATIGTASAYIADVAPPEQRARAFGMIGVAFGLGFVIGPAIGGLLGGFDPRLPFWVAAGLCLANVAFGWFVLPESLPPERRMAFEWRRANPLGSLTLLRSHRQLLGLAGVDFLGQLAHQVLPAVFVLYTLHRFGWGEAAVGLALAGVGISSAVVQGTLVGPLVSRWGERRTLVAGLLLGAAGMAIYGLAPTGPIFCIGIPVMALWGLAGASVQGLMTQLVSPSEQGQLQGASTALMAISGLIGPGVFVSIFAYAIREGTWLDLPGAPWLLAALLLAAAAMAAWRVTAAARSGALVR